MRPTSINDEDAERLLTSRRTTSEYEGDTDERDGADGASDGAHLLDDRARASGVYTHITDRTGSGEEEGEDILGNGENALAGVSCEEHSWRALLFFDSLSGALVCNKPFIMIEKYILQTLYTVRLSSVLAVCRRPHSSLKACSHCPLHVYIVACSFTRSLVDALTDWLSGSLTQFLACLNACSFSRFSLDQNGTLTCSLAALAHTVTLHAHARMSSQP